LATNWLAGFQLLPRFIQTALARLVQTVSSFRAFSYASSGRGGGKEEGGRERERDAKGKLREGGGGGGDERARER
jgi:hypothetical protein